MADDIILDIRGVTKTYGVVKALTDVSFCIKRGEIHTVLGENGAGKSTLVKIISGETPPDGGEIFMDGSKISGFSPSHAHSAGIYMVHQELAVFENLTVAENMFPDFRGTRAGFVDRACLNRMTQEKLDMFGLKTIKPQQSMSAITLGGQQMVEILRCIGANPKVIILDEPTSGLNDSEAEQLMTILRKLRNDGLTVIYISHRLKEIMDISDRVTVLRDGRFVKTFVNGAVLTENDLIGSMVGRDLSALMYARKSGGSKADLSEVVFELRGVGKKNALKTCDMKLHRGEVVGVFGLEGSGTARLSRVLYGLERRDKGDVFINGEKLRRVNPREMVAHSVMYLNNNRKSAGLALNRSVAENITMPIQKRVSNRFGFVDNKKLNDVAREYVARFSIALPSLKTRPRNLSGGNQQKVMLSACLAPKPKILIVNEPTRGVDVGAKAEIHGFLEGCAADGVGILIFSSEMPELMKLCDRILVMRDGGIVGELTQADFSEQTIMRYAAVGEAIL